LIKMAQSSGSSDPRATVRAPWADTLFALLAQSAAWLTLALLLGIIASLVLGAMPAIREYGLSFLWRSEWDPVENRYGGLVMIYGTLMTSFIALLIAVIAVAAALVYTGASRRAVGRVTGARR